MKKQRKESEVNNTKAITNVKLAEIKQLLSAEEVKKLEFSKKKNNTLISANLSKNIESDRNLLATMQVYIMSLVRDLKKMGRELNLVKIVDDNLLTIQIKL